MSLSFREKALITAYLVLRDHAAGIFPPTFRDQQEVYENEISFRDVLPGMSSEKVADVEMRKPFWFGRSGRKYFNDYCFLTSVLQELQIGPSATVLEVGCGSGWMSEFLAITGYNVTASTLAAKEVEDVGRRLEGLAVKGIQAKLNYLASPMETIHENVLPNQQFDCAFVYEALHHAFSWEDSIKSVSKCLTNQGWLIICNEPNWFHTIRSYRGALLSNTHEIGFRKSTVTRCLRENGFHRIKVVRGKVGFYVKPFWIAAQLR